MKLIRLLVAVFVMCCGCVSMAQNSLVGYVATGADRNSVIRSWNEKLILYSEDSTGQGYFSLVDGLVSGSAVAMATVPPNVHVHDFRIFEDKVYFGGDTIDADAPDTNAIVGHFGIEEVFAHGGAIGYVRLNPIYRGYVWYQQLSIRRLQVYRYGADVHIFAVGNVATTASTQQISTTWEAGLFDIVEGGGTYKFTLGTGIHSEGVFFDIANTDNYLVTAAHKGPRTDMEVFGYMLLRPFSKDADPLNSISGANRADGDGVTVVVDNMLAVGTGGDAFMLAYTSADSNQYQAEVADMYVDAAGEVRCHCHANTSQVLDTTHDHDLYDVAYEPMTRTFAMITNCNQSGRWVLDLYGSMTDCAPEGVEMAHQGMKMNSVCEMSAMRCAMSGSGFSGLGVIVQDVASAETCMGRSVIATTTANKRLPSEYAPCMIHDGRMKLFAYRPVISNKVFVSKCEK